MTIALTTEAQRMAECPPTTCPICDTDFDCYVFDEDDMNGRNPAELEKIEKAAHCCLWKQFDHPTRCRIIGRVEDGDNWNDAINGEKHV